MGVVSAKSLIEARQPARIGEISELTLFQPRERSEIGGQPALISRPQLGQELLGRVRTRADQLLPSGFRSGSARNEKATGANGEFRTIEIEQGRKRRKLGQSWRSPQKAAGFTIHAGQRPIEAGPEGVLQKPRDEIAVAILATLPTQFPIFGSEDHGYQRRRKRVNEPFALAHRLLKLRYREAGVIGDKRALRLGGFEFGIGPTALFQTVADNHE